VLPPFLLHFSTITRRRFRGGLGKPVENGLDMPVVGSHVNRPYKGRPRARLRRGKAAESGLKWSKRLNRPRES
jgi:hypothetical protein